MSIGGFKAFIVTVDGRNDGGTTECVENILKEVTNSIVNTNQGWSFDTSKNDANTCINVGSYGRAQFLLHENGAKLCVALCLSGTAKSFGFNISSIFNNSSTTSGAAGVTNNCGGGLMMSMIPPGKGDYNTTNITQDNFMPAAALRFCGFGHSYSSTTWQKSFIEDANNNGKYLYYMIVVRDDQIIVVFRTSDYQSQCGLYTIGNIINCAQNEDTNSFASFNPVSTYVSYDEGSINSHTFNNASASTTAIRSGTNPNAQIYARDGGLLSGSKVYSNSDTTVVNCRAVIARNSDIAMSYISNYIRFTPFQVCAQQDGTSNRQYGIVSYDGYKGIINPEIMCQVYHADASTGLSLGAKLNGGNYMHLCNGVIIGWDPSNTVNFWTNN